MTSNAARDWVLATEQSGFSRHFAADALPVSIGGAAGSDIHLAGVTGSLQIGKLDDVFFVQPGRETLNLRVDGELVRGSRKLTDGSVISLDTARLLCRFGDGRLVLTIEGQVTAGDTTPPDLDELARGGGHAGEVTIRPISFRTAGEEDTALAGRRPSKAAIAVGCAFTILAVLGWFAFTAKSVQLQFDPGAERIELPGTWFKFHIGDRYMLRTGTHRVTASLPGYYPLDTSFKVGQSLSQSVQLKLTKLPGLITLTTTPDVGAKVTLDGKPLGTTPLTDTEIRPGKHRLEFSAQRYLSEVRELDVAGEHKHQKLDVRLTPNWAPVSLESKPAGAEVTVDGKPAGITPLVIQLTAGERDVEVRLHGYNAWQQKIVVNANEPQQLPPVTLKKADGRVALQSAPSGAAVDVDGRFRGRTPLTLRLRPGRRHRITLTKAGYETATRELTVEADSGRRLRLTLEALYGDVKITSEPKGAEIWVDDRRAGTTPSTLKLTALEHRIQIRRKGFAPQSRKLTPRPGFLQSLDISLEELNTATGSGYPRVIHTSLGQELRLIPAGSFQMGSPRGQQGRLSSEVLHAVKLTHAFYLGVREVSNAEFRAFKKNHDSGQFGKYSLNGDRQPVVQVSWDDAVQYLNWLSIRDGLQPVYVASGATWVPVRPLRNGYRLPTEAEWAWAARAADRKSTLIYPWGDKLPPPDRSGNYADIAAAKLLPTTLVTYNDAYPVSAPSGVFKANAVGIYDLGGNVAEWVQDFWTVDPDLLGKQSVDPLGPKTGRFHVVRGSSWRSATVTELRLAYRVSGTGPREDLGFRIARNLE